MIDINILNSSKPSDVFLVTRGGLKYWLVSYPPRPGLQLTVATEDPSIFMHSYGGTGPGGPFGSYLFCYKGTEIGFVTNQLNSEGTPSRASGEFEVIDEASRISGRTITAVGTPVYDGSYRYVREKPFKLLKDENGDFILKASADIRDAWVTGFDWNAYSKGKRDTFPSREIQNEMIALWPDLFNGLIGELREAEPNHSSFLADGNRAWRARMRFSPNVLNDFQNGSLIDG